MKTSNSIKSLLFLAAILFSFSVNAYNSLSNPSKTQITSLKNVAIDQPQNNSFAGDNIIFEELENENDTEDLATGAFLALPFFFQSFAFASASNNTFFTKAETGASEPRFLSIRVLRI
jgi:hypothetical protein